MVRYVPFNPMDPPWNEAMIVGELGTFYNNESNVTIHTQHPGFHNNESSHLRLRNHENGMCLRRRTH